MTQSVPICFYLPTIYRCCENILPMSNLVSKCWILWSLVITYVIKSQFLTRTLQRIQPDHCRVDLPWHIWGAEGPLVRKYAMFCLQSQCGSVFYGNRLIHNSIVPQLYSYCLDIVVSHYGRCGGLCSISLVFKLSFIVYNIFFCYFLLHKIFLCALDRTHSYF